MSFDGSWKVTLFELRDPEGSPEGFPFGTSATFNISSVGPILTVEVVGTDRPSDPQFVGIEQDGDGVPTMSARWVDKLNNLVYQLVATRPEDGTLVGGYFQASTIAGQRAPGASGDATGSWQASGPIFPKAGGSRG